MESHIHRFDCRWILNLFFVASSTHLLDAPDLMNPALTVGHGDIVEATNAKVFSSDGDVGATRLGTLVGCGRRVGKGGDLVREREEVVHLSTHSRV